MALNFISTKSVAIDNGVKIVIYGGPGVGKTTIIRTAPNPYIFSAESGLLSLADVDIPGLEIKNLKDLADAYQWAVNSEESKKYDTFAVDSISEIAETILASAKKTNRDPRNAYGELNDKMLAIIKSFRDIKGKNIYISARESKIKDDFLGKTYLGPMLPGQQLGASMPYYFDEVFRMEVARDETTGNLYRLLRTVQDDLAIARDRSGTLDEIEKPDLTHIFNKIITGLKNKQQESKTKKATAEIKTFFSEKTA